MGSGVRGRLVVSLRRRLALVGAAAVAVLLLGWWATAQGYIPPLTGMACRAVGYPGDPDYETLVNKYGEHPWCARTRVGEAWF